MDQDRRRAPDPLRRPVWRICPRAGVTRTVRNRGHGGAFDPLLPGARKVGTVSSRIWSPLPLGGDPHHHPNCH